ncbi:MAG: hypothetical protein JXA30_13110 [Deltaproteobacteria bacterium]|nr:hypothetical protein [Deltaproteobacteria bacterium]
MRKMTSVSGRGHRNDRLSGQYAIPLLLSILGHFFLSAAPVSADALEQISFRDRIFDLTVRNKELFVVGFPGIMLHSADQGETFSAIDVGMDDALFDIDIAPDGIGAVVGRAGLLMTTTDGGKTWKKQTTGAKEHLFSVSVISGGKIWAAGHFGTIIHSSDGGKTWTPQEYDATLPEAPEGDVKAESKRYEITAEDENEGAVEEARLNSVAFADAQNGWITGEFGLVLHTEDGGETWKRQRSNVSLLMFTIRAITKDKLVAVGSEGTYIETEDGGNHWNEIETGVTENLYSVSLLGNKCIVAGQWGLVLVRDDAKGSFTRVPTGLYSWLGSTAMIDSRVGFVAGGRGYLLKTSDGGMTWEKLSGR